MSTPNPSVPRLEPLDISVVVPVHNESGAVAGLVQEIATALNGWAYEMIFVDDTSKDDTHAKLVALKATYPALRVLANRKNAGQSRAIMNGVLAARAPVIGTLDGDGQNDPADLPALLQQLNRPDAPQGLAFVGGRRVKRQDSQAKKLASRLANNVRQALLRDGADDSGCGIKVVRRDLFLRLPYFDHMHRYMPALVQREGAMAEFAVVNHRHRSTGASKYTNLGRLLAALTDLGGVIWLRTRRRDFGHVDET
ncbi:glycosyltransferase family 2 protein [Aquidulcibacter sp.]|jgi:glycosyltransferase involved in cell wall biosynthesis|uniref:glycosyltransferase family 2 protein n=1 Tax=Aquidulcibacter sp. TaxID=2052990 RepID=UPI0037BF206D